MTDDDFIIQKVVSGNALPNTFLSDAYWEVLNKIDRREMKVNHFYWHFSIESGRVNHRKSRFDKT